MAARIPPHNLEAEQSILGALMLDRECWDAVAEVIEADDFYRPHHQKIFQIISELQKKNLPVDIITVSNLLQSQNQMAEAGGTDYLIEVLNKTISSANIQHYASIVKEKSKLRKLIQTSTQIIEKSYEQDFKDIDSFIDQVEADFFKLGENKKSEGLIGSMEIVKASLMRIEELYKKQAEITGLATGFTELDKMTSGLQPGELTIIAARPSMGKTAFSLNLAQHVSLRQKKSVAYFSLEMGRESMMMRMLASEAKVSMSELRTGRISDSAWPKLISAASTLSDSNFFIDETSGISPFEIRSRARRLKTQVGLDLIMIDYLQLMDLKQKVESRERAVSEISRTLKAIAKELKVPIVALAQLNRGVEGRSDRRPMLSDLRESGSIEQDADVIMMLYRDDYYDREDPDKQGQAEVIVGKQRNGPTGTVKLKWEAKFGRFRDADPEPQQGMVPPQMMPPPVQGPPQGSGGKPKNFAPTP